MARILLSYGKGLGDHIRFSGIVREYAKNHEAVGIFSTTPYHSSVAFLFRDLPNVHIHIADSQKDRGQIMASRLSPRNKSERYDEIKVLEPDEESGVAVERAVYGMANVPFEKRWDSFHVGRAIETEATCFSALVGDNPYLFVHDDERYRIDPKSIDSTLPVIRPNTQNKFTVFDYRLVLERAAEIHVIESSFMFLVDQISYEQKNQKLFLHRYARPLRPFFLPILRKPWHILDTPV